MQRRRCVKKRLVMSLMSECVLSHVSTPGLESSDAIGHVKAPQFDELRGEALLRNRLVRHIKSVQPATQVSA